MEAWINKGAELEDIVISTRVRLARNLNKIPFPHMIKNDEQKLQVIDAAKSALPEGEFDYIAMKNADAEQKQAYIERHMISRELAQNDDALLISSKDGCSGVMVLEEDHFRIQAIESGLAAQKALQIAQMLDRRLNSAAEYAFDDKLGYLTSCPTNVGTGLRISVMLHLPALTMTKSINAIIASIGKLGFTARGIYGEGTAAVGDVYQISNQITLGRTEVEIADSIEALVKNIAEKERNAREKLYNVAQLDVTDKVMRSLGTLKYAVKLSSDEAMRLISMVNMGVGIGIIKGIEHSTLYNLMVEIMPYIISGDTAEERDVKRAVLIQKKLT